MQFHGFTARKALEVDPAQPDQAAAAFLGAWEAGGDFVGELNLHTELGIRIATGVATTGLWDYASKLLDFKSAIDASRSSMGLAPLDLEQHSSLLAPLASLQEQVRERLEALRARLPEAALQAETLLQESVGPLMVRLIPGEIDLSQIAVNRSPVNVPPQHLAHTLLYDNAGSEAGAIVDWEKRWQFLKVDRQQLIDDPSLAPAALMIAVHRIKDFTDRLDTFFRDNKFWPNAEKCSPAEIQVLKQLSLVVVPRYYQYYWAFEDAGAILKGPGDGKLPDGLLDFAATHLRPDLMRAPFPKRVLDKPEGHNGAALTIQVMLERMEQPDLLKGQDPVGTLLNETFLSSPLVIGHQNRILALKLLISNCLEGAINEPTPRLAKILTYGGGPVEELVQLFKSQQFRDFVTLACKKLNLHETNFPPQPLVWVADLDPKAIVLGTKKVEDALQSAGYTNFGKFVDFRVADVTKDIRIVLPREGKVDLLYCAGLLDYFRDPTSRRILKFFAEMCAVDGINVCTYVSPGDTPRPLVGMATQTSPLLRKLEEKLGERAVRGNSFPITLDELLAWKLTFRNVSRAQALHGDPSLGLSYVPNLQRPEELGARQFALFVEPSGTNVLAALRPNMPSPPRLEA